MTQAQKVDPWGRVVLPEDDLLECFYNGFEQNDEVFAEDSDACRTYNKWCKTFDTPDRSVLISEPLPVSPDDYHEARQNEWMIPVEFQEINIKELLFSLCQTDIERDRVELELALYEKYNAVKILNLSFYITTALKEANVWWGVGRGSSVSSYCLYLLGMHKVNSIKYGLDINEFLKD